MSSLIYFVKGAAGIDLKERKPLPIGRGFLY